jgi:monooxygenase
MDRKGYQVCVPQNDDPSIKEEPWLNLSSGYIQRTAQILPKQGSKTPWKLHQNYVKDVISLKFGSLDDGVLRYSHRASNLEVGSAAAG